MKKWGIEEAIPKWARTKHKRTGITHDERSHHETRENQYEEQKKRWKQYTTAKKCTRSRNKHQQAHNKTKWENWKKLVMPDIIAVTVAKTCTEIHSKNYLWDIQLWWYLSQTTHKQRALKPKVRIEPVRGVRSHNGKYIDTQSVVVVLKKEWAHPTVQKANAWTALEEEEKSQNYEKEKEEKKWTMRNYGTFVVVVAVAVVMITEAS